MRRPADAISVPSEKPDLGQSKWVTRKSVIKHPRLVSIFVHALPCRPPCVHVECSISLPPASKRDVEGSEIVNVVRFNCDYSRRKVDQLNRPSPCGHRRQSNAKLCAPLESRIEINQNNASNRNNVQLCLLPIALFSDWN